MTEEKVLNETLRILNKHGSMAAYEFLYSYSSEFVSKSSQFYNYLYCLAALAGKSEDAIKWIEEAILGKEMWYRPDVFKDDDLHSLFEDKRFQILRDISSQRYKRYLSETKTICTWKSRENPSLLMALHGNQQNIEMCSENWDFLKNYGHQVEYLQSSEIDSINLFRWSDDGDGNIQLKSALSDIPWNEYSTRTLCGFSSGCNVILRSVAINKMECEQMILVSPWIPYLRDNYIKVSEALLKTKPRILFVFGELDSDCIEFRVLVEKFIENGMDVVIESIADLGHSFPENFNEIVTRFIKV